MCTSWRVHTQIMGELSPEPPTRVTRGALYPPCPLCYVDQYTRIVYRELGNILVSPGQHFTLATPNLAHYTHKYHLGCTLSSLATPYHMHVVQTSLPEKCTEYLVMYWCHQAHILPWPHHTIAHHTHKRHQGCTFLWLHHTIQHPNV